MNEPYSIGWLIYSIIPELIYIIYIFIFSELLVIDFGSSSLIAIIDLSGYYKLLILIPILIIIRNIYFFFFNRKEIQYKTIILRAISDMKNVNSKNQIRQYITKHIKTDPDIKSFVLKHLTRLNEELEQGKVPLLRRSDIYRLTKRGIRMLQYYNKMLASKLYFRRTKSCHKKQIDQTTGLEMWTENELRRIKEK